MIINAILLCAGNGSRLGGENKLLRNLGNKSIFERSINVLVSCEIISKIVIVTSESIKDKIESFINNNNLSEKCEIILGGKTRPESVFSGLNHINLTYKTDIVVIHDGARCLVKKSEILSTIESAKEYGSGIAAVKCKDSIKQVVNNKIISNIDRDSVYLMQTPQTFVFSDILNAYKKSLADNITLTDDASALEYYGKTAYISESSYENIKITTSEDLIFAQALIEKEKKIKYKIGFGEDTHKLAQSRKLILGGVNIPNMLGLIGHSDADVLVHSIIDALLGACAQGDIGMLFPDNDEKYKDADSMLLLKEVFILISNLGYKINNLDATISAQKPKLSPYILQMRQNIADTFSCDLDRISIKATTTEKLGYIGREEGISSRCVCMVEYSPL